MPPLLYFPTPQGGIQGTLGGAGTLTDTKEITLFAELHTFLKYGAITLPQKNKATYLSVRSFAYQILPSDIQVKIFYSTRSTGVCNWKSHQSTKWLIIMTFKMFREFSAVYSPWLTSSCYIMALSGLPHCFPLTNQITMSPHMTPARPIRTQSKKIYHLNLYFMWKQKSCGGRYVMMCVTYITTEVTAASAGWSKHATWYCGGSGDSGSNQRGDRLLTMFLSTT